MTQHPLVGWGLLCVETLQSPSDKPHSVGLQWTSDQPDAETFCLTTHNTHKKHIHAAGGIRTRSPSKLEAPYPRLRQRGHWGSADYLC